MSRQRIDVALLLLAGVFGSLAAQGSALLIVRQAGRSFSTRSIEIARGDTVQFSNEDEFDHQIAVTSPSFNFESAAQPPGTIKAIAFTQSGTFDVHCEIHPRMHLAVTVK